MSVTMSADAHTQMMNQINALGREVRELKDQIERERYEHNKEIMKQQDAHYLEEVSPLEKQVEELSEENEELKTSVQSTENYWKSKFENAQEEKDAHWNDWLNKEFGDELYPISPSPEPDEFVEKVKSLTKSNKQKTKMIHKFREQIKGLDKVMLSSAFQSWREVQVATNPQYTIQDEIDFLNGETTNQELIKEVFEDLYPSEYEYDMKNKTYIEEGLTESDEE
jgi:predicted  nucleic acid-binding Zn-ribbon protein